MRAFRIALKKFGAKATEALSGMSGYVTDGRWHSQGRHLDYAAESRSLATIERLVHFKRVDLLAPHVIYTIELPDDQVLPLPGVPAMWDHEDLLPAAQALGNNWFDRKLSPALRVPSAACKGEFNLMINAQHPAWKWEWVIEGPEPFTFDGRLAELIKRDKRA